MTDLPHYTEYDTRLGAYAVIVREGQVLLALWNEPAEPAWTLPGGGVELAETVEEGAVREVREETGYDVELGAVLGVDTLVIPTRDRPLRAVRVVYAATVVGGGLTAERDGTTDEARWFPLAEVPALRRVDLVEKFVG